MMDGEMTSAIVRRLRWSGKRLFNGLEHVGGGLGWRLRSTYRQALHKLTVLHRRRLRNTLFVGITGSTGKTTAKDLIAAVLESHFAKGRKNPGSLNWPEDMVQVVLKTRRSDAYCVVEISTHGPGTIALPISLVQPAVGVVTNIGADHFSAFGNRDAIAQEKGRLIASLPESGIAILNADDPRVLAMRARFRGRTVTYGLAADAMLRGDAVRSVWPDRLSLTASWNGESVKVTTQLCGSHWASAVLAALATGVALGVPLARAAEAVRGVEPFEGRMQPVVVDGITFIRDDWKAPLFTVAPSLEFLREARAARKIVVIGTISDCPGEWTRRYVQIARQAMAVADCVVFVGACASACLRAKRDPSDRLLAFPSLRDAAGYLSAYLRAGDLVLMKGSHKADHMQRLLLARTVDVKCWQSECRRQNFCDACELLHVPSGPQASSQIAAAAAEDSPGAMTASGSRGGIKSDATVVIGLGNPEDARAETRHNVGYRAVERLARRLGAEWAREGALAMVAYGELGGMPICLMKVVAPMNDIGPVLFALARDHGFDASRCVLVHDDLDLPLGAVRARKRGGDGGHRGVRSIIQSFQDDKFRRVKIGIGKPAAGQTVLDYVLGPFPAEQHAAMDVAMQTAANEVVELIEQGCGRAAAA